jgi:hypothetical protein
MNSGRMSIEHIVFLPWVYYLFTIHDHEGKVKLRYFLIGKFPCPGFLPQIDRLSASSSILKVGVPGSNMFLYKASTYTEVKTGEGVMTGRRALFLPSPPS